MEEKKYPGILIRAYAAMVDSFIYFFTFIGGVMLTTLIVDYSPAIKIVVILLAFFLPEPLLLWIRGFTIGQQIYGIRVKYKDSDRTLSLFDGHLRFLIKVLLGWLSFILIFFTKNKQAIHDKIVGSIVVYK